ncbi:hypothetical protein BWZ20_04165 [Winogradskyella sp. J14-2]|uniref:glycosyltransferase family 2 protein n=1 Tax=Winogradskyella sp. J14-2 TaxID=1936080 RepID=UPI000972CD7F|nr:glycosyltransferase family A protein [Winogradskyella sp. J14-2]APY07539.1 hypothetical protein BWZ20_04165 [Winogradskyella sp. J14-2]
MIEVKHNGYKIIDLYKNGRRVELSGIDNNQTLINQIYVVAAHHQDEVLLWYQERLQTCINREYILNNFKPHFMWSYTTLPYIGCKIGYVEDSPFINVDKSVKYSTWLMGSDCGVIHSKNLLKFRHTVNDKNFDFALNSIAKLGMAVGLWCYSVPQLLSNRVNIKHKTASIYDLYRFIALHYKKRWLVLFFINLLIYEKRLTVLGCFYGVVFKKRKIDFSVLPTVDNTNIKTTNPSIDVIIPTMGRKTYLYNFLKDLKLQSILPTKIIIVEQNPDKTSSSELDYIYNETWPFKIVHKFIHKTGACNARNMALDLITSNYVFFADDDIRINDTSLLQQALVYLQQLGTNVLNFACLQLNEIDQTKVIIQWAAFGSGCSIVNAGVLKTLRFNMAFEHGYGEDVDFGMQLRRIGEDIIYISQLKLLHLKAPLGGFRASNLKENIKNTALPPKPSPSIMLFRKLHHTKTQLLGYKTILCLKYYKHQHIKNPIAYLKRFRKRWQVSESMAQALIHKKQKPR